MFAMANALVEIRLGNVESRIVGPAPRQRLDRVLNPRRLLAGDEEGDPEAVVYEAGRGVFLSGALPRVKATLAAAGVRWRLRDLRFAAPPAGPWRLADGIALRDYQREVVEEALRRGRGLVDVGTGGGKTLLAAAIVANLSRPTLWVVTTRTLLHQTVACVRSFLGVDPGVLGEGERRPAPLTVALIQSLLAGVDLSPWRGGTLVFDEGHHAAAASWQEALRRLAPRYPFFLSAVPFRTGADQAVLDALAGKPLTRGRFSARFLVERGYACPVEVRVERCALAGDMREKPFGTLYREFIVENRERNARIAAIAGEEAAAGRSVLVLVEHVRHGEILLSALGAAARFVHGDTPRGLLAETVRGFSAGALRCLVATTGLFQEGVSIDGLHALVLAGGLKSRAKVLQAVGRGMRLAPGKTRCLFFDFYDDDEGGVFRRHSRRRLEALKEEGFVVPPVAGGPAPPPQDDVPPQWAHVPGSWKFLLVDGRGEVRATAACVLPGLVPDRWCKGCPERATCDKWRKDDGPSRGVPPAGAVEGGGGAEPGPEREARRVRVPARARGRGGRPARPGGDPLPREVPAADLPLFGA